jgi:autotransporter-associated beta strand protein
MKRVVKCFVLVGGISSPAMAQTLINGNALALQSSGAASGTEWTLSNNGYVGTYVTLSAPTAVTFTASASGTASGGLNPDMTISIADSNQSFDVSSGSLTNYTYTTPTLAAGTYFVRTQLDNQNGTQNPDLTIGSLSVSGSGVSFSNSNSNANALAAATTYADNYRSGPATISLTNAGGIHLGAGTQVQVKLISNAFNFTAAVYGNSPYSGDTEWINGGTTSPVNSPPSTTEQINYQNAVTSMFNAIVPSNAGKWVNNEYTQNSVNMNLVDAMDDFALTRTTDGLSNPMTIRMHNLLWNTEQPTWVNNLFSSNGTLTSANKTKLLNAITSRINYYLSANNPDTGMPLADAYTELDVLNEGWHGQSKQVNYLGALGISGVASIYAQVAAAVAAAGANTRLYTNEYNVLQFSPQSISSAGVESGSDPYANWYLNGIQQIQEAGGPVSGVGMEMYVGSTVVSPAQMEDAMQNLSVAKDPSGNPIALSLSEFGNNGSPSITNYDTDLTDALTMIYGTPQGTTFGYWGGIGGPDGGGTYALYNSSYQLTTVGQTFENWMSQWETNETLTTDANGDISFNGTYGLYEVSVGGVNYELDLEKGTTNYGLMTPISNAIWDGGGGNSSWSTAANWSAPLNANAPLIFTGTSGLTNANDSPAGTEYGGITFNSGAGAFFINGNAINLAGDVVNNSVNRQTIYLNLAMQADTNFNAASGNLVIYGSISGAFNLTKLGSHTLTLNGVNAYTGTTVVSDGTLIVGAEGALPDNTSVFLNGTSRMQLAMNTGGQTLSSLSIAAGASLDITNNHFFVNYGGSSPLSTIESYIISGYNGGTWNGSGITSSVANSNYGIGYADSGDVGDPAQLPTGQLEVAYTLYGDTNLDGTVNSIDFGNLAANFGKSGKVWDQGDFDYNGTINSVDFGLLASNFGKSAGSNADLATSADWAALDAFASANGLMSEVPEPTAAGMLMAITAGICLRRRRKPPTFAAQ